MKTRKTKKGFTIVELVIVIAVIGVLSAVLIPTFINLTNKANQAADESLVKNLNTALATQEALPEDKKNNTLHDAVLDLDAYGYKLENLAPKSDKEFVWNRNTNRFVFVSEVPEGTEYDYFKIQNSIEANQKFSVYAGKGFNASTPVNLSGFGFDVGYVEGFEQINYVNNAEREVVIRTNSAKTNLTINAPSATIHHFEEAGKVDVQNVDLDNCYNEFGKAAYVKVTNGKIVAKDGGEIAVAFAANLDKTKVAVIEDQGKIEKGYTVIQPVSDYNKDRTGGIDLVYSIDGEHAGTATPEEIQIATNAIEETGELSVASETGVQPAGMDYTAVVNNVGYDSLQEAITAATAGQTVSLLKNVTIGVSGAMGEVSYYWKSQLANKDRPAGVRYATVGIMINKNLVINGNGYTVTTTTKNNTKGDFAGVSLAINSSNVDLTLKDLKITTTEMSAIYVAEDAKGVKLSIEGSEIKAASYSLKVCNGADNGTYVISNSNIIGWAAVNARGNNCTFNVSDSDLSGENTAAQSSSNNYASFVLDGDTANDSATVAGTYGSNNIVKIKNTKISATSATANSQTWLGIQYGAINNTVTVEPSSIINPDQKWTYTEYEEGITNTVTILGNSINGVIEISAKKNDPYNADVNGINFAVSNSVDTNTYRGIYVGVSEGNTGDRVGNKYFKIMNYNLPNSGSNAITVKITAPGTLSENDISISGFAYGNVSFDTTTRAGYTIITFSSVHN